MICNRPNLDINFQNAPPNSVRSPCPALNSLSAHGYLPRSGRNIGFLQLFNAIRAVYNTSIPLSLLLTLAGFLLCGHNGKPTIPFLGTIDLHDFALHGGIEHDASLAHADAGKGERFAPTTPDMALLKEFLNEAGERDTLVMDDIARVRGRREAALALRGKKLNFKEGRVSRGEVVLILSVIGDGEKVSTRSLMEWMGEERLPKGWKRPERSQGLIETALMARKVQAKVKQENEKLVGVSANQKTRGWPF